MVGGGQMRFSDHKIFEDEVRRVARALWPKAAAGGAAMIDGRERDGVFDEGEIVHIVEATVSQRLAKVRDDLSKSVDTVKQVRRQHPEKLVKIWIVTAHDPTADQKSVIPEFKKKAKCPIEVCGFRSFSAKLIDSAGYLQLRQNYPFGSVRNPADDKDIEVPATEYVPLEMLRKNSTETYLPEEALKLILDENDTNIVVVGDYGSGKSMTLRALFYQLQRKHLESQINRFPVYLNLRDHFGQSEPAEALIRHANHIGMADPNQLVAGWRAGCVLLFLDGFDEVSAARLVRGSEKIKQGRRQAVRLVREFIDQSPKRGKVVISGREHYFDSHNELMSALGLKDKDLILSLNEFTQDQITEFLEKKGIHQHVPDWLPSRPLLLGYLVVRGLLGGDSRLSEPTTQEDGWNYILDRVCEREASQIDPVLIEPKAVREFIERLASKARNTVSRRGPLFIRDISSVFESVFDMPPDEKAEILILRLPGLTSSTGGESSREFIDDDFVDACRAGDVSRFVCNPFDAVFQDLENATAQMGGLGCRLAASLLNKDGVTPKQIGAALENAADKQNSGALSIDLLRIIQELNLDYIGKKIYLRDGFFDELEIYKSPNLSNICFQECYFTRVEIDLDARRATSPRFERCQIDELAGPISVDDIPENIVDNATEIGAFAQEARTNADILALDIPMAVRVLLTVLRKLFVQSGSGRKENAFYRGLDTNARAYVSEILELLEGAGFAHPHKINGPRIWMPNRAKSSEAKEVLRAPQKSNHSILIQARNL